MATETEQAIYVVNSLDSAAVILTFIYSCHFVWKYIAKRCINKKFVNFFYIVAFSILAADLAIIILVFVNHSDVDSDDLVMITHSTCYIAFMLLTICTLVHITTGIKIQTERNHYSFTTTNRRIWCNYIACFSLLALTIVLDLIARLTEKHSISFEILSLFYSIIGIILLSSYIFSFFKLIGCLNQGVM